MEKIVAGLILFISLTANAQQYGAQWLFGTLPAVLDFRDDTVTNQLLKNRFSTFRTVANICDENGHLLYMTNGIFIGDSTGKDLQGDVGLSPCPYTTENANSGLDINQATLFIPKPGNNRYYYLFHYSGDDTVNLYRPATLYYSVIDKEGNGGLGSVIRENIIFCTGHFRGGGMTACKHANGRDYWLIQGEYNTNRFFEFLVTPDTILGPFIQSIGPVFVGGNDIAYSKFSQDGNKYATVTIESLVLEMDFDRCSGEFSNPVTIFNNASTKPGVYISGGTAVEFSPDNRFLYVADNADMNQYDLSSPDIDSVKIYLENDTDFTGINFIQLGLNGKLYCSTWSGGFYFFDVINYPNEKGDSCDFVLGGQPTLSDNSFNLPNMINYELGPLVGSTCDTITGIKEVARVEKESILKVFPNPATDIVTVDYGFTNWSAIGVVSLVIVNEFGQIVYSQPVPQYSGYQRIDVTKYAAGIYTAYIKRNEQVIAAQKFAKF